MTVPRNGLIPTKIDTCRAGSTPAAGTNNYGRKFRTFCRFCYIYRTFWDIMFRPIWKELEEMPHYCKYFCNEFCNEICNGLEASCKRFQLIHRLGFVTLGDLDVMLVHRVQIRPATY